jgi:hypothetical protein
VNTAPQDSVCIIAPAACSTRWPLPRAWQYPVHVRWIFSQLRVERPERVGEQQMYLFLDANRAQPSVRRYFSQQSALVAGLVRYVRDAHRTRPHSD